MTKTNEEARMKNKTPKRLIDEIIDYFFTQKILADKLNISQQSVSLWLKKQCVSINGAICIEKITKGKFKKSKIRPDIFS